MSKTMVRSGKVVRNIIRFPAGESHVTGSDVGRPLWMPFDGRDLNGYIFDLLLAADIERRQMSPLNATPIQAYLPYLPYSRQDRVTAYDHPFSLKVFGDVINTAGFQSVITLDVHSDVAFACIDNLINLRFDPKWFMDTKEKTLVVPDQGAFKRLTPYMSDFSNTVIAIKNRCVETGRVWLQEVVGDYKNKECVIVDDICDGGATFIALAKHLLEGGAAKVELVVSHGIFSRGVAAVLDSGIDHVYTSNSFPQDEPSGMVTVMDTWEVLLRHGY